MYSEHTRVWSVQLECKIRISSTAQQHATGRRLSRLLPAPEPTQSLLRMHAQTVTIKREGAGSSAADPTALLAQQPEADAALEAALAPIMGMGLGMPFAAPDLDSAAGRHFGEPAYKPARAKSGLHKVSCVLADITRGPPSRSGLMHVT